MIAKVHSIIPYGYSGRLIEVEGDISKSLPSFNIVGMANKTVSEARERVRSAITNSSFSFPDKKVTVNLAPAELNKDGSHLDLPIALSVLTLSQQILQSDLDHRIFVGELSLDGFTKPVRGIINIIEAAKIAGYSEIFLPAANLAQASLIAGVKIFGVTSLLELVLHLKGVKLIQPLRERSKPTPDPSQTNSPQTNSPPTDSSQTKPSKAKQHKTKSPQTSSISINSPQSKPIHVKNTTTPYPLLDDIQGQALAKRALTIAIAGHHNILLSGPPGSGKSLLAKAAANLLPPPSPAEQIEITKLHSLFSTSENVISTRPFRSPHHTASCSAMIGGGIDAKPGEVSLAHRGVLFLDELPEYPKPVLEALRQPLEDRTVTVTRLHYHLTYPADFMLIATMNPCPCGYLGDPHHPCTCTTREIDSYRKHLSGPILDRIDMVIHVSQVETASLCLKPNIVKNTETASTEHSRVQQQILQSLTRQAARFQSPSLFNSSLTPQSISNYVKLTPTAEALLKQASTSLRLSARVFYKIIKVAQTIADLEQSSSVLPEHISEALSFRQAST